MDQFEEKKWFVFLGDHHEGPFSMAEMRTKVDDKAVTASSFVWAEGMTDWKLLKEIPAFEGFEKNGTPSRKKETASNGAKTVVPSIFEANSLPLDRRPLRPVQRPPLTSDQIEKSWKRRRLIRKALKIAGVAAVLGGGAFVYQQGMVDPYIAAIDTSKIADTAQKIYGTTVERVRPQLLALAEKYPVLSIVISPIPRLKDVSTEDYDTLRAAASAHLDQGGPVVALVAAKGDPAHPVFYVSTNLPDGATFDVYIEGVRETLVGKLHAFTKVSITTGKNLGMTSPIRLANDAALPMGEYQVFATESEKQPEPVITILKSLPPLNAAKTDRLPAGLKLLARRAYFFGGPKDDSYAQKLRDYHSQLAQKARIEMADLKDIAAALDQQIQLTIHEFKKIRKGKGITPGKRKAWASFHTQWIKNQLTWLDRFVKLTPEALRDDYVYAEHYEVARQAGQDLQKLHDMQNDFFENRLGEHGLDIQLGTATSVVESAYLALKTKIEQAEKAPAGQGESL